MNSSQPAPFEQARLADIVAVVGTPLFRAGRRLRGECPICGASKGKRAGGAFSVDPENGVFKCFACGKGGDVIALEFLLRGGSLHDAALRLAGVAPPVRRSFVRQLSVRSNTSETAVRLWTEARSARGTIAEIYFAARGLSVADGSYTAQALQRLRFHPAALWGRLDGRRITRPAIVARVEAPTGPTGGFHITYLAPCGKRKTRLVPSRRMLGPQSLDGRAGGVLLSSFAGCERLIVAEGIETALSAASLLGPGYTVAASLSLDRLQGGWSADRYGRYNPDQPTADFSRPAFSWAHPDHPWSEVIVCVDRDMSPIRVKVRRPTGGSCLRELGPNDRAKVCAGLATQHWRRAQPGLRVSTIAPALGLDFNDELRGRRR